MHRRSHLAAAHCGRLAVLTPTIRSTSAAHRIQCEAISQRPWPRLLSSSPLRITCRSQLASPRRRRCDSAPEFVRSRKPRRIVAVGGGSVLDWGRLVWAYASGALETSSGKFNAADADRAVSFCLVPTTCGTGAEAADVVVYSADDGSKRSVVCPMFMADQVVLDGRFLDGLPLVAMAGFVCDAISHAVESYLSVVPGTLAKMAAVQALGLLFDNFGESLGPSRQDRLMEGSFLGGVAAANCSVGIVHAFAHSVGQDAVPHGIANAAGLDSGMVYNAETRQMTELLAALGLVDVAALRDKIAAVSDIALQAARDHDAFARLHDASYRSKVAERMAKDVTIRSNPRRPDDDELECFVSDIAVRLANR